MIVPLKKITVISTDSPKTIVEKLGKIGVMHIKENGKGVTVPELHDELERIAEAKHIITSRIKSDTCTEYEDVKAVIDRIIATDELEDELENRHNDLKKELLFYELFGVEISTADIRQLKREGIELFFYETDNKEMKNHAFAFVEKDDRIMGAAFSKFYDEKEIVVPDKEYPQILEELKTIEIEEAKLAAVYAEIGVCTKCIDDYKQEIENKIAVIEKESAVKGYEELYVNAVSGFIKENDKDIFVMEAQKAQWAYSIDDTVQDDEPPVMLKNPKPVEHIIYPFYDFMGSWPSPFGKDPSIIFALFIVVFGAILIGDAGYGVAFIIAAFALRKKIKLPFLYYLGAGCIIWGSMTGTWFSNVWLVQNTPLRYLVNEGLSSYFLTGDKAGQLNTDIQSTMGLMFILGGIHLTIAKLVAMSKSISKNMVLTGDIFVIWGMVYVVRALMAGEKNTGVIVPLITGGVALSILGIVVSKETIGKKIVEVVSRPLALVNVFADTMSYIRLFAVGFASLIVGMVGSLIAGMTGNILAGAVIVIVINSINLSLGLIAILVHAVRLNNLEFANNSEIQLGTPKFNPFKI